MGPDNNKVPKAAATQTGSNGIVDLLSKIIGIRELFLLIVLLVVCLILSRLSPYFFTYANIRSVSISLVPNAIIAIGMTILLVSGVFDLSVGGTMALAGTVVGLLMANGMSIPLAILLVMITGVVIGTVNGVVISKLGVNPLIATFAMLSITRSVSLILTDGYSVMGIPPAFNVMGTVSFLRFPLMVWTMLVLVIVFDIMLRKLRFLRQVFFIGGNENAALLSGIKVDQVRVITYIIAASLSTIAGIILSSRLMAGTPTAGAGIELAVIAACVIGGASLKGGEGSIAGAFLGVLFLGLISNALIIMRASIYWHGVVNGLILITAVSLDMWVKRRKLREL